jgi:hypothetical protein
MPSRANHPADSQIVTAATAGVLASKSMTTVVGIRETGFVVLASDSRSSIPTRRGVWSSNDGRKKLHVVGDCLFGFAGDDEVCDRWLDVLAASPQRLQVQPHAALAEVANIREHLARARSCPPEHLVANAFAAWRDREGIFRLVACDATDRVATGLMNRIVNSPAEPGVFPLRLWLGERPAVDRSIAAAVLLVLETALVDRGVGGPVQVGVLDHKGARLVLSEQVATMGEQLTHALAGIESAVELIAQAAEA